MQAPRRTPRKRGSQRFSAAVASLLAIHAVGPPGAFAAPKSRSLHQHSDHSLLVPKPERIRTRSTTALHDRELVFELEQKWRTQQLLHAHGMRWTGVALTATGGVLWGLLMWTEFAVWAGNRYEYLKCRDADDDCWSDGPDFSGLVMIFLAPQAAATAAVGIPLLVAGAVRAHLAARPGAAVGLRKVGAALAWSGLGVVAVGVALSFIPMDPYDSWVPLETLVSTNVGFLGLLLGFSGVAVWSEARRAQELRKAYGFRDQLRWKPAVDRQARARHEASRRAGLPPAYLFTHAFQF